MRRVEIVCIVMVLIALYLLPVSAERSERERIVNQCRAMGSFEAGPGVVFRCKEKVPKT